MEPLKKYEFDGLVVEIYGGWSEIGGNCVVVKDGNRKIVFDQGVRYGVLRQFYSGRVEPLGVSELRSINAIPSLEVLDGAEALYISHPHIDHVGLLSGVPTSVEVILPKPEVFKSTIFEWYKGSSTWLSYVPPYHSMEIGSAKILEMDSRNVVAIPVYHSGYPSVAYIYFGKNATLFYSGDLRLESPATLFSCDLRKALEKLGLDYIDIAIVEGTNFGLEVESFPVTTQILRNIFTTAFLAYELITVSIDPLDLELFSFILDHSTMFGRKLAIASKRVLWMLKYLRDSMNIDISNVFVVAELEVPPPIPLNTVTLVDDIFVKARDYTLIVDPVNLLEILRKLRLWTEDLSLPKAIAILTDPEPREAPKEVEERVISRWLKLLGFDVYRLRLSGHYHCYQFPDIINIIRPKKLIPMHTELPMQMLTVFEKIIEKEKQR